MRALTFQGPGVVHCESVPDPAIAAPGDAIVRVELAAICGSDLHVWRGHERGLDAGTVLGHELLGEVVETGPGVRGVRRGTRVVAPFTTSCGECFYCRRGLTCRCTRGELFGWVQDGRGLPGAQAQYVRVPLADTTLSPVPDDVARAAVLFCGDILATGLFCAEAGDVHPGALVAVIGCGPVGLMAALAARTLGAARVFAIDDVPERLRLAARYGAEAIDRGAAPPREIVLDATEGRGADCVLEAVGSAAATRLAFELVRPGGTIAACGVHTESAFAFTPGEAYDKNLTYRAGRCPAREYFARALGLARTHERDLLALVSHTLPLEDGPRGYEMFDRKQQGCTKVLLTPGT